MPTQQRLDAFYKDYLDIRAGNEVLRLNAVRNIKALEPYGIGIDAAVLDYGSGKNAFSACAVDLGGNAWKSFDPYTQNSDRHVLRAESYDAATCWGVLEHVVDPMVFVRELAALLRPGGHLFMTTVDIDSAIPFRYKPPEHLTYWSRDAASVLCERNGMELLAYRPYFMIQDRDVYMRIILRTVPDRYRNNIIFNRLPHFLEVPTNEVFIVARKPAKGI